MQLFDYNKYLKNNPLLKEEVQATPNWMVSAAKDLAYKLPEIMPSDSPDGTYSEEQILLAIKKFSPLLKRHISTRFSTPESNHEIVSLVQKYIGNEEERSSDESPSGFKLGDVFVNNGDNFSGEYYILAKSKNPNKPNVVGLWRINPKTMQDSPNWPGRKMWDQTQVVDPNNISSREWLDITGGANEFEKVN